MGIPEGQNTPGPEGLGLSLPGVLDLGFGGASHRESQRMAAHRVEDALELANLALSIAERVPGEEGRRSRLMGYCWAHVGNARRVANDLSGADEAFTRTWDLWLAGADSGPDSLAEWRLLDLEASLRRAERRFQAALELLDKAQAAAAGDDPQSGRLYPLEKRAYLQPNGRYKGCSHSSERSRSFVESSRDFHLLFALRFNMADDLCHLERYEEAVELLQQVREMGVQQGYELDLIRIGWLSAKVAAGKGRVEEAIAGLEQVSRDFRNRDLPYDAALSSLDLALLCLKAGRTAEVRELAMAMGSIFRSKKIEREVLAALKVFCDAARQESATVELTERVIAEIEQVRRSASPRSRERGRG